jgi:DNA-binding CsgD family transcriptional regulator
VTDLAPRELEFLRHAAAGATRPETAKAMHISLSTAKNIATRIFGLLGAQTMAQAVAVAYERGILKPPPARCCRLYLAGWLSDAAERVSGS